jgi:hypothetical protein
MSDADKEIFNFSFSGNWCIITGWRLAEILTDIKEN